MLPVLCRVCIVAAAAVAAANVAVADVAAAAAGGSLAAMRPVAKESVRVHSSDARTTRLCMVSSGAEEVVKLRVARVVLCLSIRDPLPLQCRSLIFCDAISQLSCPNLQKFRSGCFPCVSPRCKSRGPVEKKQHMLIQMQIGRVGEVFVAV